MTTLELAYNTPNQTSHHAALSYTQQIILVNYVIRNHFTQTLGSYKLYLSITKPKPAVVLVLKHQDTVALGTRRVAYHLHHFK